MLSATTTTLDEVVRTTRDAVLPAAGGFVDTPNQWLAIRHFPTIDQAADLARVPVAYRNGAPLELGRVADVVEGFPPPIGDASSTTARESCSSSRSSRRETRSMSQAMSKPLLKR